MLENLTFNDGLFVILAGFFLTVLITPFITLPEEGWRKVMYLIEIYIIVSVLFLFAYKLLKEKSDNASYLAQERIFMGLFFVMIVLVGFIMGSEIFSQRKTKHGFLFFVSAIVILIILIIAFLADTALTQRYGLDYQNPFTMFEMGRYYRVADSYKN
tara:strand:- start:215 stop:685 length:471 start_codon:yes stop_codon:yes gene_type:complete